MNDTKKNSNLDPGHWLGLIIVVLLCIFFAMRCQGATPKAKIDTMACKVECITKYVTTETVNGNLKYYAVYKDESTGISDIIPVPKNVMEYINVCKQNGIKPSLAIRLKNGIILNIIRYKPKYVRKR